MKQPLRRWYTGMVQDAMGETWTVIFRELLSLEEAQQRTEKHRHAGMEAMLLERATRDGTVIACYEVLGDGTVHRLGQEKE